MILTVTMNPTVDIRYEMETLKLDTTNRVSKVFKSASGKGLNVARVLSLAGREATATGVIGGMLGQFIARKTEEDGILNQFMEIAEESRNCVAILHDQGKQTEILEAGPTLTGEEQERFLETFKQLAEKAEIITLSGSLPKGLPADFYKQLVVIGKKNDALILYDTSGKSLRTVLENGIKPDMVKINLTELSELLGREVPNHLETIKLALESEFFSGIEAVIITLGKDGAKVKWQNVFYSLTIPQVKVVNPVGSGDSTLGGFALGMKEGKSVEETLKTGMTFGILNAMESQTGFINMENFDAIYKQVVMTKI